MEELKPPEPLAELPEAAALSGSPADLPPELPSDRTWSALETIGWFIAASALAAGGVLLVFALIGTALEYLRTGTADPFALPRLPRGPVLIGGTLLAGAISLWVLAFVTTFRTRDWPAYFGIRRTEKSRVFIALSGLFLYMQFVTILDRYFPHESKKWLPQVLRSQESILLTSPVLILAVPVIEELLFRGFLYKGLRHSRLGATGAITLTAAVWALSHTQYDGWGMTVIFGLGLYLGTIREWTGSSYVTTIVHAINNLLALLGTLRQ